MVRIIIDAGHGGTARAGNSSAFGSRGPSGTFEKDVTLDIARQVAARLGRGAAVTRTDDRNLSLGARASQASRDGADVFVSIHANSGPPEMSGPETWVHPDAGPDSHELAGGIQRALERLAGRYGGSAESRRGPMAVLNPRVLGKRTSACLVEVDYLSNPRGEQRLGDPSERAAIGAAIADAIQEHVSRRSRYGQVPGAQDFVLHGDQPRRISVNVRADQSGRHIHVNGTATHQAGTARRLRATQYDQAVPDRAVGVSQYLDLSFSTPVAMSFRFPVGLAPGIQQIELAVEGGDPSARVRIERSITIAMNEHEAGEPADLIDQGGQVAYGQVAARALDRPTPDPYIIPDPSSYRGRGLIEFARVWLSWFGRYASWRSGVPADAYAHFPHSAICELGITLDNGGQGFGTGFFIGPNKILTCGHNFRMGSRHATRIMVRPGKSPTQSIFPEQEFVISNWRHHVHPSWAASQDFDWDLAVLNTPGFGAPNGDHFSLPNACPAPDQQIVVCGYGKFRGDSTASADEGQYMDGATISNATYDQYHFPIQAIPGHSGSPVFWPAQNSMVVAVLTGPRMLGPANTAPLSDYENRGVKLTPEKNDWINSQ